MASVGTRICDLEKSLRKHSKVAQSPTTLEISVDIDKCDKSLKGKDLIEFTKACDNKRQVVNISYEIID